MTGKRDVYELERALGEIDIGKRYRDTVGPAIYQVEPTWATAILCARCGFVALIPTLPRTLSFVHRCSSCGQAIRLAPPLDVIAAGPPSSVVPSRQVSPSRTS